MIQRGLWGKYTEFKGAKFHIVIICQACILKADLTECNKEGINMKNIFKVVIVGSLITSQLCAMDNISDSSEKLVDPEVQEKLVTSESQSKSKNSNQSKSKGNNSVHQSESSSSEGAGVVLGILDFAADVATKKVITDIRKEQNGDLVVEEKNLIGEKRTTRIGDDSASQTNEDAFSTTSVEVKQTEDGIEYNRSYSNKCCPCFNYEYGCGPDGVYCNCGIIRCLKNICPNPTQACDTTANCCNGTALLLRQLCKRSFDCLKTSCPNPTQVCDTTANCCNGTALLLRQGYKGSVDCLKEACPNPTQICEATANCCNGTASLVVNGCRRTGDCFGDCLGNCPNPGELCDATVSCIGTMGECIAVPFQFLFAILECFGEILGE